MNRSKRTGKTKKTKKKEENKKKKKEKEKTEGEKETKKKETLEDIVKNLVKERKSYEHTQIIDKLNEEFSTIKNELTKKGFESADTKEKSGYNSDKQKINVSVETLKKLKLQVLLQKHF